MIARFSVFLAALAAAITCVVMGCQRSIVFPTSAANQGTPAGPTRADVEQVWIEITPGSSQRVEGWFIAGHGRTPESPGPAVMFFHGNGDLIDYAAARLADFYTRRGVSILLPEYRGYGRSAGSPSQKAITADMIRFRDWLDQHQFVDRARVIYHGQSLGGGVAGALALHRPPAGVILESTFTSMRAMFRAMFVPGFLALDPFETDRWLRTFKGPVVVIHGTDDRIVPVSHGRSLAKLRDEAVLVEIPAGHNDVPIGEPRIVQAIEDLLAEVWGQAPAGESR